MRGIVAIFALIVSIGGLLVVIAYGASNAYLDSRDDEINLDNSLLLGAIAPQGWEASNVDNNAFKERFIAPCLQTPLLNGTSIEGRGAYSYLPPGGGLPGVQLLLIQTSPGDARAIMDDVARDTEDDCERGAAVGTIESAAVEADGVEGADRSFLVDFDRQVGEVMRTHLVLILQQETYIAHLSYELTENPNFAASDLLALGTALADRIEDPPTTAQLAAAGALDEPSAMEQRAQRVNDETSRLLTASGRYPELIGIAGLGVVIVIFYVLGARLSRTPEPIPDASRVLSASNSHAPEMPAKTVADYGVPERRWIAVSERGRSMDAFDEADFEFAAPEPLEPEEDDEPEPSGPPPVLEFPQKSIEEKLKILKDARLKEPRREHRAVRDVTPNVDWTEEISKAQDDEGRSETEPPTGQVSRKALLKKLRANADSE